MIRKISTGYPSNEILAIIVNAESEKDGVTFVTPDDYSQQLAYMKHPAGFVIKPHVHNEVKREIMYTKETLVIVKGKMRCDFYSDDRKYLKSSIVNAGDVILLVSGGHGFECLEDTEMFEVKQGPYAGENDKVRFEPYCGAFEYQDD